ncbi:LuxR C-terminal-related transcriptional regulator [Devosia sp. 1635]|uniref:response regulator transcription factor n=1 Tax=Devosia sp. 1635 TaxID=2726066 RepID=UPI001565998A|nr:LuxR C-terminal-related transcriptional regulator [Devosia sp. 1635]
MEIKQFVEEMFSNRYIPLVHVVNSDPLLSDQISAVLLITELRVEMFETAAEFVMNVSSNLPDAVIMNMQLDDRDGILLLDWFLGVQSAAKIPVIMVGDNPDAVKVVQAFKMGAADVLTTPISASMLLHGLRELIMLPRTPAVPLRSPTLVPSLDDFPALKGLTPRELEVLRLIAEALTTKEIGRKLLISPRTVEVYRGRILEKLQARNAVDLMRIIVNRKLPE